ncbi:hypothetical protein PGT21_000284 [Puccinia graminis f. sp. tritici]|uniref:tRNA wybutosine-synthesizing protein 3 n=1 Tax=Puccinia graminis f. sp. tritici TaxID=56615 RepID=A0A5B0LIW5_PUCGR|nr:hypothetical protein PGT21_000284 [Puccinia graminis f. sp. tritici]
MDEKTVSEYKNFEVEREQIALNLAELKDKSTKGTIDEPIRPFLDLINAQPDWISTSTCSGRLVSYLPGASAEAGSSDPSDHSQRVRQAVNGKDPFGDSYRIESSPNPDSWTCDDSSSLVVHFVYQPPVFHLLAKSVTVAVPILTTVIGAGFRNSGITVGHRGRVILAIRASTGGLDVPIAIQKCSEKSTLQLLVPVDYLSKLLLQGNQLMHQNQAKLERLFEALSNSFNAPSLKSINQWESAEDRRQRMRLEGLAAREASLVSSQSNPTQTSANDEFPELSLIE